MKELGGGPMPRQLISVRCIIGVLDMRPLRICFENSCSTWVYRLGERRGAGSLPSMRSSLYWPTSY